MTIRAAALLLVLALAATACGRYGAPVRPRPVEAAPPEAPAPEAADDEEESQP